MASGSYYRRDARAVGLKVLKTHLSEYVRVAASGETVLITDRDRAVAELVPPTTGRGASVDDAVLAHLVRSGYLTPPLTLCDAEIPRRPVARLASLLKELDRDRADPFSMLRPHVETSVILA